jgi:mannan endo-1,6-alpha-mannosidase
MTDMCLQTNGSDVWRDRAERLTDSMLEIFFPNGIAYEVACEGSQACNTDMHFYKGYTHRWLSSATQVAPFLAEKVLPVLQTSAEAAARTCRGGGGSDAGAASQRCGFYWANETSGDVEDMGSGSSSGAGEGLSVFAAVTNLLVSNATAPATGATSSSAGNSSGTGQGGLPSGTSDGSSPSGTAASGSGAGRFRAEMGVSLLVGGTAILAWAV